MRLLIIIEETWGEKMIGNCRAISLNSIYRKISKIIKLPYRKIAYGSWGIRSNIVKPLFILGKPNIFIGNRVLIREMARIEAINEYMGLKYNPKLVIEDDVTIEQGVHITCSNKIDIGKQSTISSFVYISDTNHGYEEIGHNILKQQLKISEVEIGEYVFIGTGVKILPGVHIGKNAIIGANAVVVNDVPEYSVVAGVPAEIIKYYDFQSNKWVKKGKKNGEKKNSYLHNQLE